jgi:hypothetical protein
VASDNVVDKVLDQEAVIINLDTGMYYGLDGPAAKVWECIAGGISIERIVAELERAYPGRPQLEQELEALVLKLSAAGLLAAADEAGDDGEQQTIDWPSEYQALDMTCYDDVADMIALDPPLPELSYERLERPRGAQA